jgi:phosphoglycerate dehydrogenase-like enzyme
VAEFTLGLILSMNYEIPYHDNYVKKLKLDSPPDGTHKDRDGWLARGLSKSRVGILGSGSIARHMVAMLAPFKCDILMSDPYLAADDARQLGVRKVDIDTLMKESDVLTVHAAWTNETEGILSRAKLSLLKHNALVINTARMPIFDEQALFDELTSGRLRACLNLIPFNAMWHDDAIRDSRNVYLSCSTATVSDKTYSDMGDMIADDVLHFLSHRDLQHKVTPKMYARMT